MKQIKHRPGSLGIRRRFQECAASTTELLATCRPNRFGIYLRSLAFVAILPALTAHAQIGSGWHAVTLDKAHAFYGGTYTTASDVETFTLPSSGQRMEIRLKPDYGAGKRQFQGEVNVTGDIRSAGTSITQVYQHGIGLEHQTRVDPTGKMYTFDGHDTLATNIFGVWIRLNIIHSIPDQTVSTYVNGSFKATRPYLHEGSTYMTKYGIYLAPDSGSTNVKWRSAKLWNIEGVSFWQNTGYGGGVSQVIAPGNYTMSQLASLGVPNDSASSCAIPVGWTVTAYRSDNFSGTSFTLTGSVSDFTTISGLNDAISSVKITAP
jgi:hypothetical protein